MNKKDTPLKTQLEELDTAVREFAKAFLLTVVSSPIFVVIWLIGLLIILYYID